MFLDQRTATNRTTLSLSEIPSGARGVAATLDVMRKLVRAGKINIEIRGLAASLTSSLAQKNYLGEIKRLHQFVRDNIRYLRDIHGVETVQTPEKTLELGYGDCDDKATLLASLLESIGHPTRFVAVGFRPGVFSHVYVETRVGRNVTPTGWLALETTEPVRVGWSPPGVISRMIRHN